MVHVRTPLSGFPDSILNEGSLISTFPPLDQELCSEALLIKSQIFQNFGFVPLSQEGPFLFVMSYIGGNMHNGCKPVRPY